MTARYRAINWVCHAPTTVVSVLAGKQEVIAECSGNGRHSNENAQNARRIAACLNACDGIDTETLERAWLGAYLSSTNREIAKVTAQRFELLAEIESLRNKLADETKARAKAMKHIALLRQGKRISQTVTPALAEQGKQAELLAVLSEVNAKFCSRPYGTGSYIPKKLRDKVRAAVAKAEG